MSDWGAYQNLFAPSYYTSPLSIMSVGAAPDSLGSDATAAWPQANRAFFIPFRTMAPIRITQLWVFNGATASGNLDIGIYDKGNGSGATRIISTASKAQSGTNAFQIINVTATRIGVGQFYMALTIDNTTGTTRRFDTLIQTCRVLGMAQQSSAFPLPATASFATISSAYLPIFGFVYTEG